MRHLLYVTVKHDWISEYTLNSLYVKKHLEYDDRGSVVYGSFDGGESTRPSLHNNGHNRHVGGTRYVTISHHLRDELLEQSSELDLTSELAECAVVNKDVMGVIRVQVDAFVQFFS